MIKIAKSGKDWIGLIKNWILFGETEIIEQTLDMALVAYSDMPYFCFRKRFNL